jgi:hypothetical protein
LHIIVFNITAPTAEMGLLLEDDYVHINTCITNVGGKAPWKSVIWNIRNEVGGTDFVTYVQPQYH